jgi:transcriptional regulator with XRE-family HTH domain
MLGEKSIDFGVAFGTVIRRLRKQGGISQEKLGFDAELQRNYISLIELGRYQPTLSTLFKLAYALKVTPASLVEQVERQLADPRTKRMA